MRFAPAIFCAASAWGQLAPVSAQSAPAIDSIHRDELKADLFFLASDAMRGRLTATPEYRLAAEWIASRFARLGLKPAAREESFYHSFDLMTSRLGESNKLLLGPADSRRTARLGEDYYPLNFSASGEVRGRAVLAGYGIRATEHAWDDYKGHDVKGAIVLIFEGDPNADDPKSAFDGLVTSEHANAWRKAMHAQDLGASAVIFITNRSDRQGPRSFTAAASAYWPNTPRRIERYQLASNADAVRIPVLQISQELAEHLLATPIAPLRKQADTAAAAVFHAAPTPVEIATSIARTIVADRSVVAKIEGADPRLKDEAILITAHYDHDGADGTNIFNGADDNGSGTVAVMEIAEAYAAAAKLGQRPKRTVIFAVWGSEERGLLGSWAWAQDPQWPLDKTVASINMDMIGRSEEVPDGGGRRFNGLKVQTAASNANAVHVMGYSFVPDLAAIVKQANRNLDLTLRMEYDNNRSNLIRRSDQWPFLQHRVPSIFFHTGLHPDYHTTGDRPERIEYPKMERIARLVYQTSWDLASTDRRPKMPAKRVIPD